MTPSANVVAFLVHLVWHRCERFSRTSMNLIVKMKVVLCLSVADNIVCTMVIVIL